jgi:hypothetical protein
VAPSFNQLYFPGFGNAALQPETAKNTDLGLTWAALGHEVKLVRFDNKIRGYMTNTTLPINIPRSRIDGWTLGYEGKLGAWGLRAGLDTLNPRNEANGRQLPRRAKEQLSLGADRRTGAWRYGASLLHVGTRFDDAANAAAGCLHHAGPVRRLAGGARLEPAGQGQQPDRPQYETSYGYNQPGRAVYFTLRWQPKYAGPSPTMTPTVPLLIPQGPQRIVCLTEETTEWLYLLGQEARIVGISGYTVRPRRAREEKPKVSAFLSAKIDKILALQPDCVFGFSDLQADIASALIKHGVQVTVFNQRSVEEIFSVLYQVAAMVGQAQRGLELLQAMRTRLLQIEAAGRALPRRPRVFFEEWDEPHISAIQWVSQLAGIAGGTTSFPSWPRRAWASTASLPMEQRSCGATPTSSSARGAARSFVLKRWPRARGGRT